MTNNATDSTAQPTSDSNPTDKVNLGPLGEYDPIVFWSFIGVMALCVVCLGVVLYKRRARRSTDDASDSSDDEERRMASSANRAGWFGEKRGKSTATVQAETREARMGNEARVASTNGTDAKSSSTSGSKAAAAADIERERTAARQQRMAKKVVSENL